MDSRLFRDEVLFEALVYQSILSHNLVPLNRGSLRSAMVKEMCRKSLKYLSYIFSNNTINQRKYIFHMPTFIQSAIKEFSGCCSRSFL